MSTAAGELRAASTRLRELARAVETDIATNPYWASEKHPPHDYPNLYARGVDNGLGGPAGTYAAALHLGVGDALADWLEFHAAMDERLLALVDGAPGMDEATWDGKPHPALTLARQINGSQT